MRKSADKFGLIFTIGFLAYSSIYIARLNFAVASAAFEMGNMLTKAQIGIIGSVFSFTYAIAKVPGGVLGDRYAGGNVIAFGLLLTGLSNLAIAVMPTFGVMTVAWGINALGQSMLWGPLLRTMSEICTEQQYKTVSRSLGISIAIGSIAGIITASFCLSHWGVKACFAVPAALSFMMAAAIKLFFPNVPGHMGKSLKDTVSAVSGIVSRPEFKSMLIPSMGHGMIKDNINVWLAVFFVDAYAVDISKVGGYVFFIPLMSLLGKTLYPVLYKYLKSDYKISISSFILCIVCSLYLATLRASVIAAVFCMGMLAALVAAINTHILSVFPGQIADSSNMSFAASVMDLLVYGGAGIGSLIFGGLIQKFGYGSMFAIWAAASVISTAVMFSNSRKYKHN